MAIAINVRGEPAPTLSPSADRVALIDSLRAAALCGVIVYNFVGMVGGFLARAAPATAAAGRVRASSGSRR